MSGDFKSQREHVLVFRELHWDPFWLSVALGRLLMGMLRAFSQLAVMFGWMQGKYIKNESTQAHHYSERLVKENLLA